MGRRALPWLLAVPVLAIGSIAAHSLAYRLAVPDVPGRANALEATGHGYLAQAPFVLGVLSAFLLAGLVVAGRIGAYRASRLTLPAWPLALLPLVAFTVQEHAERALSSGTLPLDTVTEPAFLVGLVLQIPFGLVSLALGRWLGQTAAAAGAALARAAGRDAHPARGSVPVVIPGSTRLVRRAPLVSGFALRAPPA
ncbi:MAG: hypothetical protein U0R69_02795 [Gaiellales bacterium]